MRLYCNVILFVICLNGHWQHQGNCRVDVITTSHVTCAWQCHVEKISFTLFERAIQGMADDCKAQKGTNFNRNVESASNDTFDNSFRYFLLGLFFVLFAADLSYVLVKFHFDVLIKEKQLFETTVKSRTAELVAHSEALHQQRDRLMKQQSELQEFNVQLTESIEFAKHLQDSHLQGKPEMEVLCGDHFLIYKPKYSVGGDFYWSSIYDDKNVVFCVVDCTGHGIPGALMSMVGLVAFKDVVLNQRIVSPAAVLEAVHQKIVTTLSITTPADTVTTAMDVAFCMLNRDEGKLWFSGAHCPIFLVKNCGTEFPSLLELHGDKRLVGNPLFRGRFTEHCLDVSPGDMIYLFTDGLVDQLEQHERRKFSRNMAREMFVQLCKLPTSVQQQEILKRIDEWKGSDVQTDDITVLGIRV